MTFKNCLEIGLECGMETVDDSLRNIAMHAMNIFEYSKINEEVNQAIKEAKDVFDTTTFTIESSTKEVLDWFNLEDDNVDETKLNL